MHIGTDSRLQRTARKAEWKLNLHYKIPPRLRYLWKLRVRMRLRLLRQCVNEAIILLSLSHFAQSLPLTLSAPRLLAVKPRGS